MDGGASIGFSAINAAFTFADLIARLNDVPEEARRFSTLIQRVRLDYYEAIRLHARHAVQARFIAEADEKAYIEGTIRSAKRALEDIGMFVEKIRVQDSKGPDGKQGSISIAKRVEWLWRYRSKVDSSERVLDTSHKSLLAAVQRMQLWISASSWGNADPSAPAMPPRLPTYDQAVRFRDEDTVQLDDEFVKAMRRNTKIRRGQKSLSDVSVRVIPVDPVSPPVDRFTESSPRLHGPVDLDYISRPTATRAFTPAYAPSVYSTESEPFPPYSNNNNQPRTPAPMRSMASLRTEYNQFSTTTPHRQSRCDDDLYRTYSERDPRVPFTSAVGERERPRSAAAANRSAARARLGLVSNGTGYWQDRDLRKI